MSDLYRYEPANHGDPDIGLQEAIEWGMVPVEPVGTITVEWEGGAWYPKIGVLPKGTYLIVEADDE